MAIEKQRKAVQLIVNALPELAELYQEHVDDYEHPLPYVFLADAVRHFQDKLSDETLSLATLEQLASAIDSLLNLNDSEIDDLVVLALLVPLNESIVWERLRTRIGKKAIEELARYRKG